MHGSARAHIVAPIVAVLAVATALLTAAAARPAPAGAVTIANYVAMGDSYSAGVGAGGHRTGGGCDRSSNAYPAVWARAYSPASFVSVACAGARVDDVIASQVTALSVDTSLVSLTIGGNDAGFSSVLTTCNLQLTSRCVRAISTGEVSVGTTLPGKLATMFASIRANAPHARVVLLGYPHFYDLGHDCAGLSQESRRKLDEGVDVLDAVLAQAAADARVTFADVRRSFTGHEICDGHRWLHALNFLDVAVSYHPSGAGQARGYLPVFAAAARD